MARSTFVYVTYIRTTPEKLWSALTEDVEFMKQYWFGVHCESQWTSGSSWKMVHPDGRILDAGESHPNPDKSRSHADDTVGKKAGLLNIVRYCLTWYAGYFARICSSTARALPFCTAR